ncbi:hypothetical protein Srufu_037880 [Streptomyces libani subsp. rufus]|nr:hypothetical protein Srufu_037880 [Streptomyces libani subsp. rufus]
MTPVPWRGTRPDPSGGKQPDPRAEQGPDPRAHRQPDPWADLRPARPTEAPTTAPMDRPPTAPMDPAAPVDASATALTDPPAAALTQALLAAEAGYPVMPLTRSKLPAIRSPHRGHPEVPTCRGACGRLGHGVHDASTDPLTVRRMFAAAPWATGYGIACGRPPHHLIGIDLDTKNGADGLTALRFLAEEHGFPLPPTITVLTPSGGRHLWFTGPPSPPIPNSVGRLAPGIDVRGAGGYLVGPGSLTTHGRYVLATDAPPRPAPVPNTLLTLLTAPPRPPTASRPTASRPSPPRRSYASSGPPRAANAMPASSGPPAAPRNPASSRNSPPGSPRPPATPACPQRRPERRSPRRPAAVRRHLSADGPSRNERARGDAPRRRTEASARGESPKGESEGRV